MSIEVQSVTVGYRRDIWVLQDVSLIARDEQVTAIIGPNGAGKSTLLKTIYGYLRPVNGRITYNHRDITFKKTHELLKLGIALVPQNRSVFPRLTVQENLELGTWIFRKEPSKVKEALQRVYDFFPILKAKAKEPAGNLSGGQQRMLEIGRAFLTNPTTLLLDEPTVGLSPKIAKEIYSVISELRDQEITILLVDQNIKSAIEIADYVYVLEMGRNALEGPKSQFVEEEQLIKGWLMG
jgi:branched-chain amino acid transport system ATP-binding protein